MTNIDLGRNIRKIRELKNLSQQNVADSIEITQKHLSRIENGIASPTFETLVRITETLEIRLNDLLDFDDKMIFNNYSQHQTGGSFSAYNNTPIKQIEILYNKLLDEKDLVIDLLKKKINHENSQ